ncbi:MAG: RND family transporter [Candidatus Bipolaricaulia bacterium]
MRNSFLRAIYRLIRSYSGWILVVFTGLTLGSGLYIRDLKVDSSTLTLFPNGDPLIETFQGRERTISGADYLTVLLASANADEERLKQAAEQLTISLLRDEEIVEVRYGEGAIPLRPILSGEVAEAVERHRDELDAFLTRPELPPTESRLAEIYRELNRAIEEAPAGSGGRVDPEGIARRLEELGRLNDQVAHALRELSDLEVRRVELASLLELTEAMDARLSQAEEEHLYLSPDGRMLLVNVRPRLGSQRSLAYNARIVKTVRSQLKPLEAEGIEVNLTGSYLATHEQNRIIREDIRFITIISSVGVAIIFLLFFGTPLYTVLILIPLGMGVVMMLAWAKLTIGHLNLITGFLPAVILGLGIDYGIHLLARYGEERELGKSVPEAIESMILNKGEATLTAAFTTTLVFLSLLVARSRGLYEMGIIGGGGVLATFVAELFVMPALIVTVHRIDRRLPFRLPLTPRRRPRWGPGLAGTILRRRTGLMIITVLLTLFMVSQAARVRFIFSEERLIPQGLESQRTLKRIEEHFGPQQVKNLGRFFLFFAKTSQELELISKNLADLTMVNATSSIKSLLPADYTERTETLTRLASLPHAIRERGRELSWIRTNLEERRMILEEIDRLLLNLSPLGMALSLSGHGDLMIKLQGLIGQLTGLRGQLIQLNRSGTVADLRELEDGVKQLSVQFETLFNGVNIAPTEEGIDLRTLTMSLPNALRSRYLTPEGEFVIYAHVGPEIFQEDQLNAFVNRASEFAEDFLGLAMIQGRLADYIKRDFWVSTAIAVAVILLLLIGSFRRIRDALLAILPLALGYAWMLGGMGILGISFNFINILISPLLIGIGVDHGIHLLHGYREVHDIKRALLSTGLAILVTSLTTLMVFGSLLFARTPGTQMLGISATLGIGFTTLFSLTLLPALLTHRMRDERKDVQP